MKYIISALILFAQILLFSEQPVGIFIPSMDFDWIQYEYITEKLDSANIPYFIISDKDDTCKAVGGRHIIPYTNIQNMEMDINYLIIPGCTGIMRVYENEFLISIIQGIHESNGIIASTGNGAMPIVHSGIAEGAKISMEFNQAFYNSHNDMGVKFVYYDALMDRGILSSYSRDYIAVFTDKFIRIYNENADTESE